MAGLGLTYFKRFRMEIDLPGRDFAAALAGRLSLRALGRRRCWTPLPRPSIQCFRNEMDANVFPCLGELDGCRRLMGEIVAQAGLPAAGHVAAGLHAAGRPSRSEYCGTVQGVRDKHGLGAIQNLGIVPDHRGGGLGTMPAVPRPGGFSRRPGIRRVYLEVTAQNDGAIRLYRRVGFVTVRTVYKAVECGILHVTQSILSHTYPNGLVLVAEPMAWLQSAAFTFLVPAGCVYDPADRGGLSSFTCEMALRGAGPRDSRQFILDLDNLGVERSESVSNAHTSYSGATLAENLPQALAIYADVLRRPHLPEDQLEAGRLAMLQELRAVEDEPAQKVMIELRRRHYPEPWGRPSQGEQEALEATTIDDIRRHFQRRYRPNGTILGVAGRVRLAAAEGPGGRVARRLAAGPAGRDRRNARRRPLPASALRVEPDADRHRLRRACRTAIPTTFRPGARWAS